MSKINVIDLRKYKNFFPIKEVNKFIKNIKSGNFSTKLEYGQCSLLFKNKNSYFFFRDKLGVHKYFYCLDTKNLIVGNSIYDLIKYGCRINNIFSFRPGILYEFINDKLMIKSDKNCLKQKYKNKNLKDIRVNIQRKLRDFFYKLNRDYSNYNFIVCLSGGLDSSIIAYNAKKYLKQNKLFFCSFSFTKNNKKEYQKLNEEDISEDFLIAKKISSRLDTEFIPIIASFKIDNKTVKNILKVAQDYRDFNIHCATLNFYLAKELRSKFNPQNTILITGDMMNEFIVDYKEEIVDGKVYYNLPKIPLARLRNFLIRGLETSDRELGVFHNFNFYTIQPYNCLIDEYMSIDPNYLNDNNFKYRINKKFIPKKILDIISKKKNRAQSCDKGFGALNLYINSKFDQKYLKNLFNKTFLSKNSYEIIEFGKYR